MKKLIFFSLSVFHIACYGQAADSYLSSFFTVVQENNVQVNWVTKAGFSCEDIIIEISSDTKNFETFYVWPGTCGGEHREESYTYLMRGLKTGNGYVRLNLGLYGKSSFDSFFIEPKVQSVLIYPHPAGPQSIMLINNIENEPVKCSFYNQYGLQLLPSIEFKDNKIDLNNFPFGPGVYFYRLETAGRLFSGKFIWKP